MSIFFKNRDGQTPLEESMRFDLKHTHIQNMTELYELEMENNALGIAWSITTKKDHLDYYTWLELHKQMLGDIWTFAGKIRTTELGNPDFHKPYDIRPALADLEKDLKYWLKNKTYSEPEMIALFHEKLLTIHPFKDGNGRWSRILTEFICAREKLQIPNWGGKIASDTERRNIYIAAIKKARRQFQYDDLITIMWHK